MDVPRLTRTLADLRRTLAALSNLASPQADAIGRALVDLDALAFHLGPMPARVVVALIGGTGTGKSTLANRLLGATDGELTASNFRRTFTAGPVAIADAAASVPAGWVGLPHVPPESLPARGLDGRLVVVPHASPLLAKIVLVDTPDIDGDRPQHHALADRAFRWAHAAVFVASPEKYQMPELLPFYRLSTRYGVPALFVMNKAESAAVVDDFAAQLVAAGATAERPFVQPRDDATYAPEPTRSVAGLRAALAAMTLPASRVAGQRVRVTDLAGRIADGVLEPLRAFRRCTDDAIFALRESRAREGGIDVDPMTRQLRKRMQQRSVLYLMGPQRMLERLRGAPALFARLPRSTLDLFRGKDASLPTDVESVAPAPKDSAVELPDFAAIVADQFAVAQESMADVIRGRCPTAVGDGWRIDRARAAEIVTAETEALRAWLEQRWNKSPRDTALIMKLVQKLPGGHRVAKLSESAPYLVVVACGLNHLAFSGLDLLVIGGFGLVTWLGEKVSDEVGQRTRLANKNIGDRFAALVRRQAADAIAHLEAAAPPAATLDALAGHLDDLRGAALEGGTP